MAKQKLTPKEKRLFRQGCIVGYRKAMKQMKDLYDRGRTDGLMDFLDSQEINIGKLIDKLPY